MRIDLLSVAKYRNGMTAGDDVPLVVPGQVFGVFDGATDALGTRVGGISVGRLAALTAAQASAALTADAASRDGIGSRELVAAIPAALARLRAPLELPIPPSTTAAVVLDLGDRWRLIAQGDSGFRINGSEVLHNHKIIDDVSMAARVALFGDFFASGEDPDIVETAARRAIFLGLDAAVAEGRLSGQRAEAIIEGAIAATGLGAAAGEVAEFLRGGIRIQHRYGNTAGHALSFDTLNGTAPQLGHVIDVTRDKADVSSIEIFTDGYPAIPAGRTLADWEACFQAAEERDYHKIGEFAAVKGSTSTEFFDDRTVLVLSDPSAGKG